jgi:hypothetical protein
LATCYQSKQILKWKQANGKRRMALTPLLLRLTFNEEVAAFLIENPYYYSIDQC